MNAKEALQVLIDNLEYPCDEEYDVVWKALNRLEELEKVLKIIKEKQVMFPIIITMIYVYKDQAREEYNRSVGKGRKLTEAEFNLLKEYLK